MSACGEAQNRLSVISVRLNWLLPFLLAICITRLWLMPLPSSFWIDEIGTAFVVRQGPADPSLAVVPQVPQSIYYALPRAAQALFGLSEIAYRLPSILAMALALFLFARLAARLIHPEAGWFAAFTCLALRGTNYYAADARPYALGICVAVASLMFLIRWLDSAKWRAAFLFAVLAALLWRVHLIFWPFYLVFTLYAVVRLASRDTRVSWLQAGIVFALLGLALLPVLVNALALFRDAKAHVIAHAPSVRDLVDSLKYGLIFQCGAGAWLLHRLFRWRTNTSPLPRASLILIIGWWLCQPLCLFAFSWLTGSSVFVSRYLSLALPGAVLAATAAAARYIPAEYWKPLAAAMAVGVLLILGQWGQVWQPHHNSDWRAASETVSELATTPDTPVICPSPFIEARPPVWQPEYRLPGFLYAHLSIYPIRGKSYLFPFETSSEAEQYAIELSKESLSTSNRFLLYGSVGSIRYWRAWFASRPEFTGWTNRRVGPSGDVEVVVFEKAIVTKRLSTVLVD